MAEAVKTTRFRFWFWLIRVIGVIVPRRLRADWRQEWQADPVAMIPAIRDAVRQVDKNLPLFDVKTQSRQIEESVARERAFARLTTFFGLLALLLASIGLYGAMAYSVARRRREIGIRMALGAQQRDVLRLVIRQGMLLVVIGTLIGLVAAYNATGVVTTMLYGVTPNDWLRLSSMAVRQKEKC